MKYYKRLLIDLNLYPPIYRGTFSYPSEISASPDLFPIYRRAGGED
jgi:hypothetical protein